jgi:hypothetical protein
VSKSSKPKRPIGDEVAPKKLSSIGRFRSVLAIFGEVPRDLIINVFLESNIRKVDPKGNVLTDMLKGDLHFRIDFGDPSIVVQGLLDILFFPNGDVLDERGNI